MRNCLSRYVLCIDKKTAAISPCDPGSEEKGASAETPTRKIELGEKYKNFLQDCENYLESL